MRRDERGDAKTLVRSLAQWKDAPDEQGNSGKSQHDSRPASFGAKPKPVAFGMNGAGAR